MDGMREGRREGWCEGGKKGLISSDILNYTLEIPVSV